jgi:ketosteroid isomerase-like protein
MRTLIVLVGSALLIPPVWADNRGTIVAQMQKLADAVAPGDVAVWDRYLDPSLIYAEEDDTYKGKAAALKEITPLPQGLSGTIKIALLSYHEDGDVAIALFRQIETEHYFGQTIHANYLTSTTWKKRADGWKLLAAQVLAEKTDPPAISLPKAELEQYAGTYKLKDSEATYTLTVSDDALDAARSGHKPTRWNAEASDVFFSKGDPRIRKIFQRDSTGKVIGFVERREMWDITWVKSA